MRTHLQQAENAADPGNLAFLQQAIALHSAGQLDKAVQMYQEVLAQDANNAIALHYLGISLHQYGQHEQAIENITLSCALAPDNASWHNDLGNVLFALQRYEAAVAAYADSLNADPRDPVVWNNLGSAQWQCHDTENAIASYEQAIEIAPDFAPALMHLGNIYEAAGDNMNAAQFQCRAYVLPPLEGKSKKMLGISFYFLGRLEEAADIYQQWMQEEPDNPIPVHMYAACSQKEVPMRASDGYIQKHFDLYAETFNENLVDSLSYRGPQLIGQMLEVLPASKQYDVLDLGCGTGLCAPMIAPYARTLCGVDLSGNMLEKARQRGGYDQLHKQEITGYMASQNDVFDLVLAADTLIYFGALDQVFGQIARVLRSGGHFTFTVETMEEAQTILGGYQLHPSGRYRHGIDYVGEMLTKAGFELLHMREGVLREEIKSPVAGMVVLARRRN